MRPLRIVTFALFFIALFAALFSMSMGKRLDHDEHQFVASGVLLARRALWPYRDYAYFHMPNLVIVNAALFQVCDYLLLASRSVSMLAGFLTAVLLFVTVRRAFAGTSRWQDWSAMLATLVFVCNPLFQCTSGRAWNHDVPTLLTVLAFLCITSGLRRKRSMLRVAVSGILIGLAIGTRLTFAPAALSFALAIVIGPGKSWSDKAGLLLSFAVGATVALLPSWILLAQAPGDFLFGNFFYPALNTQFHIDSGYQRSMTSGGKIGYLFFNLLPMPGNLLLFVLLCASFLRLAIRNGARNKYAFEASCLLMLIGGLLIGSFAPTPLFPVYFYEPLPFVVLFIAYVLAGYREQTGPLQSWWWKPVSGIALLAIIASIPTFLASVANPLQPNTWIPVQVHRLGDELAASAGKGRVLTYSPIFPLEGHEDIYEELTTGPFAARAARLISESDEIRFKVADEEDWKQSLRRRPAVAILTGFEGRLDDDLVAGLPPRRLHHSTLWYHGKELHLFKWIAKRVTPARMGHEEVAQPIR